MKNNHIIQEEEIDLKKVFSLLWAKKIFIVVITLLFTFSGIAYVSFKKVTPLYEGKVLVEIGEIQSEVFGTQVLDYPDDLIPVLIQHGFKASSPVRSNKIVVISKIDKDKKNIQLKLENIIQYILERHQEKAKFHKNVLMTQQIGEIKISEEAINKLNFPKIFLLCFIAGFVLTIFIVLVTKHIQTLKGKE